MIRPHPNQTDADLHNRAAALRTARYCCAWCRKPKNHPLAVEVYQDDKGEIVLCRSCFLAFQVVELFRPIDSRWQGWNR
jgi:hypothetical protein